MKVNIVNSLRSKPHPDGWINIKIFLRKKGERDFNESQLCRKDDQYQTPWIMERLHCLSEYHEKIYCKVDRAIDEIANEVAKKSVELEMIRAEKIQENDDKENDERKNAINSAKNASMTARRTEILIDLAEIKMILETINATLLHHLRQADNVIMEHISIYWSGILKAAEVQNMPATPSICLSDIFSQKAYEEHISKIIKCLSEILDTEGV